MEWAQFALLLISIGGMFAWLRSDIAINRTEAAADRRDLLQIIRTGHSETREIIESIKQEMKDFHARLATQDLEFKLRMSAMEEKVREKHEKKEKREK